MKKSVLILSNPSDFHSLVVREALVLRGVDVKLWCTSDFPTLQTGSIFLDSDSSSCELDSSDWQLSGTSVDSVWLRRPRRPVVSPSIQECDRAFAWRESNSLLSSLQRWVGSGAFWVNPFQGQVSAVLKSEQLRAATKAGFRVPRTLISNSPSRIREFLRSASRVLYKPFFPASWRSREGLAVAFSSLVAESDLPDDQILQSTPGIFQDYVDKSFEVRVTVVGEKLFAVKLHSQEVEAAKIDWRAAPDEVHIEPQSLPLDVAEACRRVMGDLGLVFGCFDLIVTPAGEYVFLEVNEMGAFLWIEERLPEMALMDAFCELLVQGRADFAWERTANSMSCFEAARKEIEKSKSQAPGLHVEVPSGHTFDESDL